MEKALKLLIYRVIVFKNNRLFNRKVRQIHRNVLAKYSRRLNKTEIREHKFYWSVLDHPVNTKWAEVHTLVTDHFHPAYIPESIYYNIVERCLNDYRFVDNYSDKNLYERVYASRLFPETIIRNINGIHYGTNYDVITEDAIHSRLRGMGELIIKPAVDSGGGFRVAKLEVPEGGKMLLDDRPVDYRELLNIYMENFLIQKRITQHEYFSSFNPSSVNTVRIFTYRSPADEKVHILHRLLRIGKPGSITDNQASGGISCGVDANGRLNDFAVDKYGNKSIESGAVVFRKAGVVPGIEEMEQAAYSIAKDSLYARLIGFDFCLDQDEKVRLLEINNKNNEINFYQMNSGPLFGDFSDEILDYCQQAHKSVCLGYLVE
jgi:hypothetical protein